MHGHIAISRGVKSYLVATLGFRSEKVWVMPNWVDPVRFAGGTERVEMRKRLGVSDGTVIVGMVARFDDPKGHGDLVAAARSLVRRYPPIVFVLVGDGATRPAITAQVVEGGLSSHFRFLGQRNDVSALLDAFDIFVLPSHSEAFPISVLEAMAAGKPVVASALDGIVDAVETDACGILVPPRDVRALEQALGTLILQPELRASMGGAGRTRILEHFAAGPALRRTEALYHESLA